MKIGIIVLGIFPSGVKQITQKLLKELCLHHQIFGIEQNDESAETIYKELKEQTDSPYESHSILKLSSLSNIHNWEEVFAPMDVSIIFGDKSAQLAWEKQLKENKEVRTLFIPISIYNDIAHSDTTLGYDTALNSIMLNVLRVKDTIHSLKYDKPRVFGFAIEGCPSTIMLEDLALAVDGYYVSHHVSSEEIESVYQQIVTSFSNSSTSNVLFFGAEQTEKIQTYIVNKLDVDYKSATIDVALCLGTHPTAVDRILANKLAEKVIDWVNNKNSTAAITIQKQEIIYL